MTGDAGLRMRRATAGDAEAVAALHADSWRRHYRGAYSDLFLDGDVYGDRLRTWTQRLGLQDAPTVTILAEDADGALIGFVHVVFDDDPHWGALLDNLHITYRRKRGGIGRQLMAEVARAVLAHGAGGFYLWVLE
ncbi:MAG TPA: GNAT family N-acetyltransferase, partial [Dehalococcoidia bacterium]|nr:GNAT family N-acetyltransferase [Dehalococcoidia bacterium]